MTGAGWIAPIGGTADPSLWSGKARPVAADDMVSKALAWLTREIAHEPASPTGGAPLRQIPLHFGLAQPVSMSYGPPGPEPTVGDFDADSGWFLRRYEVLDETWIEVDTYRPRDGLHSYFYIVDKPGFDMGVVVALDRGGQYIDLLDGRDSRAVALAARAPTAAALARGELIGSGEYRIGLAIHDRFAPHLLAFHSEALHGRLTRRQFLWACGVPIALTPLMEDLLFLHDVTSATLPKSVPIAATDVNAGSISSIADVVENVGRIASGAGALLDFMGSCAG